MAISIVQQAGSGASGNVTSLTETLGAPTTAGNCLIALVGGQAGNTLFQPAGWQTAVNNPDAIHPVAMYYLPNCPGGLTAFSFTQAAANALAARVFEVAGLANTVDPLDQKTLLSGSSTTPNVGPTPPTQMASEFCFAGFNYTQSAASTPTNGYTIQATDNSQASTSVVSSTLIQSVQANEFTGITIPIHTWASVIATFFAAPGPTKPSPLYYIKARSNSTLLLTDAGIENDYENLTFTKVFNGVGAWALQLRRESSHFNTFLPVSVGGVPGYPNGILIQVDNQDGQGLQTVFSGPQTDIDVKSLQNQTQPVLITGVSDEYYLAKRRALNTPDFPYAGYIGVYFHGGGAPPYHYVGPNPTRYYQLNESSGTVATDSMGAANGTYTNSPTLGQPGLVDDPSTCIKLNGTSSYVSVPTAGLATGNSAWSLTGWGMLSANPSGNATMWWLGSNVAHEDVEMGINSSGQPWLVVGSTLTTGAVIMTPNVPFFLGLTWDGTTATGYFFQMQSSGLVSTTWTQTPGAMSLTYGSANIGAFNAGGGNFWPGWIGHAAYYASAIAGASMATMFAIGYSRQAYLAYDTRPTPTNPGVASTVIYQYVLNNAGSSALPSTTFTNAYGTQTARAVPNISLTADPVVGSNITGVARDDNLLDLIAALALMSTTELGFTFQQVGTQLVFTIFLPTDLSQTAIFARDLRGQVGNILDYEWKLSAATANHLIAGGSNPSGGSTNLTSRLFGVGENANSISANSYLEDFLDYRQASNGPTLNQAINQQLSKTSSILTCQFTTIDTVNLYFMGPSGKGYALGNKVTAIVDGQTFSNLIRSVRVDLQPGAYPVVIPSIGTPNTQVMSQYDTIRQRLQSLGISTTNLNANY